MNRAPNPAVAIVGAGPYGVSIAAHLQFAGIPFRIFGKPMNRWRRQMPKGMFLKSEGCASNLSDPFGRYTLAQFCASKGLPYGDWGTPVSLEIFLQYALSFQQRLVPSVEEEMVTGIERSKDGFGLQLTNGESVKARHVIVATGMDYADHLPPVLAGLPPELLSHSSQHHDLSRFEGIEVTVIGGGQSALETAALLAEQGTSVCLMVRQPSLAWNSVPNNGTQSFYKRLRYPVSNLGVGLELWLHCNAPMLFRHLPRRTRLEKVKSVLGPAGAWWLKERVLGRLRILLGHSVEQAESSGGRAVLRLAGRDGRPFNHITDHVFAATGYQFDLDRLPFLSPSLKLQLRSEQQRPVLSRNFESSVPGLYFTGFASANYFGPVMRFLLGAEYTARRVSLHLGGQRQSPGPQHVRSFAGTSQVSETMNQ